MLLMTFGQAGSGDYLQWGWFSVSLANLLIIAAMVVVFGIALVLPFPHPADEDEDRS